MSNNLLNQGSDFNEMVMQYGAWRSITREEVAEALQQPIQNLVDLMITTQTTQQKSKEAHDDQ